MGWSDRAADDMAALLRLRVLLAGSGAFRMSRDAAGRPEATCVLPRNGFLVRLGADGVVQMSYPSGRPLSRRLDATDPEKFASLMHNADVESLRGREAGRGVEEVYPLAAEGGLPVEALALADAAAVSSDASLPALVRASELDEVDYSDPEPGPWRAPAAAVAFARACGKGGDAALAAASEAYLSVARGEAPGRRFLCDWSLRAWQERVEGWVLASSGIEPETVDAGPSTWVRLRTRAGVGADTLALGHPGRTLTRDGTAASLMEPDATPLHERLARLLAGMASDPVPGSSPALVGPGREYWSLRGPGQEVVALAVVEDGEVLTLGAKGAPHPLLTRTAEIAALRAARCPEPGGPAPGR